MSSDTARGLHDGLGRAPFGLGLVQGFVNTLGPFDDELDTVTRASRALTPVVAQWARDRQRSTPPMRLRRADLDALREIRGDLSTLLAAPTGAHGSMPPVSVDVAVSEAGLAAALPVGAGATWWRSALAIEVWEAQLRGTWSRLKICANPGCPACFYDRSRNNSGVWHDARSCGNVVNLRASRARRRERS